MVKMSCEICGNISDRKLESILYYFCSETCMAEYKKNNCWFCGSNAILDLVDTDSGFKVCEQIHYDEYSCHDKYNFKKKWGLDMNMNLDDTEWNFIEKNDYPPIHLISELDLQSNPGYNTAILMAILKKLEYLERKINVISANMEI